MTSDLRPTYSCANLAQCAAACACSRGATPDRADVEERRWDLEWDRRNVED